MQGWECPKCAKVFAPQVEECRYCNETVVAVGVAGSRESYVPFTWHGTWNNEFSGTPSEIIVKDRPIIPNCS